MSVKIRLRRMGMKKKPFYRIVVAESRSPRDGRTIEEIGHYNPMTEPADIKIDTERAAYWLKSGAQPTDTVRILLKKSGVVAGAAPVETPRAVAETAAVAQETAASEG